MKETVQVETIKTVPAALGAVLYGLTLNELVGIATLVYIILQCAYLIWKWMHEAKKH